MADVPNEAPHKVIGKGAKALKNLPPWAYLVIAGSVLLLVIYLRGRSAANNAANTTASNTPNSGGTYDSSAGTPYSNAPYFDPSMYGAYSGSSVLPNGTGAATNPTDTGTASTVGATTSDSHDYTGGSPTTTISPTDSHDTSTSISFGDINSPISVVGGGAPNRPSSHTPSPPTIKLPTLKPRKPPKPRKPKQSETRYAGVGGTNR